MDGVITSEERYWDCAGLVVAEIIEKYLNIKTGNFNINSFDDLVKLRKKYLTDDEIIGLKNLAINTNWDVAYIAAAIRIINAINITGATPKGCCIDTEYLNKIGKHINEYKINSSDLEKPLTIKKFINYMKENKKRGFEVIDSINDFLPHLPHIYHKLFKRNDKFWILCKDIFQIWYLGNKERKGMIHYENLLLDEHDIKKTLSDLKCAGFDLKIGTGRPYNELIIPLKNHNLLDFFSSSGIATNDDVEKTEKSLKNKGIDIKLSKPNPYLFLRAIHGKEIDNEFIQRNGKIEYKNKEYYEKFAVVGDAVSDMIAAKEIGCIAIGVLPALNKERMEKELIDNGADVILDDITHLPDVFRQI